MEKQKDEGEPVLDNQHPGQNNKTFQGADYSIVERTSEFCSHKKCQIKDYGTWMCAIRLDKRQEENLNWEKRKKREKSVSK